MLGAHWLACIFYSIGDHDDDDDDGDGDGDDHDVDYDGEQEGDHVNELN